MAICLPALALRHNLSGRQAKAPTPNVHCWVLDYDRGSVNDDVRWPDRTTPEAHSCLGKGYMERMRREAALGVCSAGEIANVTQPFQPAGRSWLPNSQ